MLALEDVDSTFAVSLDLGEFLDDEPIYCLSCKDETSNLIASTKCPNPNTNHQNDIIEAKNFSEERALAAIQGDNLGCALIDSGASKGISSHQHLDSIADQMRDEGSGQLYNSIQPSGLKFKIGDGKCHRTDFATLIRSLRDSPMRGKAYKVHVSSADDNTAPFVIGMDYLVENRCVIDFEDGTLIYKDEPNRVHYLKRARNGSLLMPITRGQCEEHWRVHIKDEGHLTAEC